MPHSKRGVDEFWQRRGPAAWLLLPVGIVFFLIVALRRLLYQAGVLAAIRLPVPVVVVGNIIAGGAGKTPLVLMLAEELARRGRRPGVISRGYGGGAEGVRKVSDGDTAAEVGDEPLLIWRRAGCPVFVGRDRVAAARALLAAHPDCDLVISDDGLQHYRLVRDVEIAVMDGRGLMNGWPLPAGPLREPASRLGTVDAVVSNGWEGLDGAAGFRMRLVGDRIVSLDGTASCSATELKGRRIHAVAGIGDPDRFFRHLSTLGLAFEAHSFPDHHPYAAGDLDFSGDAILTTEKDAVKFGGIPKLPVWVLPVTAQVEPDLAQFILEKINGRTSA
ncbi:MAG: tetraacyldisaccharide 4'-kinase [Rhodocyclaceae bacterium]|nr:tetraacyldisaccharide 4'-kinase [Rhodocyclaceae bacterium]